MGDGSVIIDIRWLFAEIPPGALVFVAVIVLIAFATCVDVCLAWACGWRLRSADWEHPESDSEVLGYHNAVRAIVGAGTAPSEADEHDYFYDIVGYRFDRARAVASSLMVIGLLGTFIGMAIALYQSSEAMVALQDDFGATDEPSTESTANLAGDEHSGLDQLRVELESEMDSATDALGAYVSGQRRAVKGMAIGVSTSIAGIFCALSLFVFIGIARRSFDRLLRHARHHRYQWIPLFDSGVAGVTAALETLPVAVANEVQRALEGVGDRMAVSMAVALSPLTKVVDKFEAELANQTNALLVWIDQQEAVTTAARVAYEGLAAAATRSESAAEENAKRFAKLVVALEANASEVQQFRDGFEDLISNLEALAKNYREAGQQFGVVVGALGHIEAHHGELGSGIQSLNGAVVLMGDQLGRQADVFNETTVESVQQLGEINRQLAATTEQSASSMVQAVDGAMRNIARTSAETSGEVVRQIGPTIARDIAKSVSELVVRQPWYSRIFPFFRDV